MNNDDKQMYGIWIPKQGWLKGKDVFADCDYQKVKQVAHLIGKGAIVRFIDLSIVDFEHLYLEQEGKSLWHTFKNFFQHNNNK